MASSLTACEVEPHEAAATAAGAALARHDDSCEMTPATIAFGTCARCGSSIIRA